MTKLERILETTKPTPTTHLEATDPSSLSGRLQQIERAFSGAHPYDDDGPNPWITDVYEDHVLADKGGLTYRVDYTIDEAGEVTFGEMTKVKVTVTTAPTGDPEAATEATSDRYATSSSILEALDGDAGWVWRVTMIRPGISKNGRRYRKEVLAEAVNLYEGRPAFDGHRDDATRRSSPVAGMAGWHENVAVGATGALESDFHIAESAPHIRQLFLSAYKANRPDLIGFSHDAAAMTENVVEGGRRISDVRKIVEVHSVDIVADPSAGGRIERLVASRQGEGAEMDRKEFLRRLKAGELTPAQIAEAIAADTDLASVLEAFEAGRDGATPVTEAAPTAPVVEDRITETELPMVMRGMVLTEAARAANLPQAATEQVREALANLPTAQAIEARVAETASIWNAVIAANPARLPGQAPHVTVETNQTQLQEALDGLVFGAKQGATSPFRSIHEAYSAYTGDYGRAFDTEDHNRRILAAMVGCVSTPEARLTESLDSTSWAQALGDSIRRRLIQEYTLPQFNTWRQIVSDVVPRIDFRTNHITRVGGYDVLPEVAERGVYQPLTSPGDEEATYAISKKGGTEDYTLEMVANDDVGALRRIPRDLGRAAALTLYRAIWNSIIADNPTIYDSVALFHSASHNNLTTSTALSETAIGTIRNKMVTQQRLGESSGFIGLTPRFLAVPPELYVTAYKLTQSRQAVVSGENATTPNPWEGMMAIEVPTWTDADDYVMIADPATCPTLEVGFYQGREEPELFVQDAPNQGSVFTADVFTWKIRHIWGTTVLDYRGFSKGQA